MKRVCIECGVPITGYKYCPTHGQEKHKADKRKYEEESNNITILEEFTFKDNFSPNNLGVI